MKCEKLEFLKSMPFAHRGIYNNSINIPENSIAAFKKAIDSGYGIELDVHILKDNKVVVFHDDNLFRMTGLNKNLKDMKYSEIRNLRLLNTNEKIPLLAEVLNLVNSKVPILIELKYSAKIGRLENEVVKILKNYKGKVAIQSFNPFSVLYFKLKYPQYVRGQLAGKIEKNSMGKIGKFILKEMAFNFITQPHFISYDIRLLPSKKIERYRKTKIILGWTIKDDKDLDLAKKYTDNYIVGNII